MAVNLSPYGGVGAQFLDNAGNVLTGGKIFTYAAGTTTPQATYTSAAETTFHTNPIILDASGRVPSGGEIWLTDGLQYKFVLKDANDVLIATYDNIIGINSNFVNFVTDTEIQTATAGQTVFTLTTMVYQPGTNNLSVFVDGVNQYDGVSYSYIETNGTTVTFTSGLHVGALVKFTTAQTLSTGVTNASLVTYDPAGTGAVSTTVQAKLRQTISVTDFGGVGDGIVDDTMAITNAITHGNEIFFPKGTYKVTSTISIPTGTRLTGESEAGLNVSIIQFTPNVGQTNLFQFNGSDHCAFSFLRFNGPGATTGTNEVGFNMDDNLLPRGSERQNTFDHCTIVGFNRAGILLSGQWHVAVRNCTIQSCGQRSTPLIQTGGIVFIVSPVLAGWAGSGNIFSDNYFSGCSYGVWDEAGWDVVHINNIWESCHKPLYIGPSGSQRTLIACWFESNDNPPEIRGNVNFLSGRGVDFSDHSVTFDDRGSFATSSSGIASYRGSTPTMLWNPRDGFTVFNSTLADVGFKFETNASNYLDPNNLVDLTPAVDLTLNNGNSIRARARNRGSMDEVLTLEGFSGYFTPNFTSVTTGTITGATQANPVVITSSTAGASKLLTGDRILISGVAGMTQLNGNIYTVTVISPTSFSINVNGTGFSAYTSGGTWDSNRKTYLVSKVGVLTSTNAGGNGFGIGQVGVWTGQHNGTSDNTTDLRWYWDSTGNFLPYADNAYNVGSASLRAKEIFAVAPAINTSDGTLKQQVRTLTEVELNVAKKCKSLIRAFKFNDSVEAKGDKARIHIGVIAQDVKAAFESEGLNADEYSLFCSDTWYSYNGVEVQVDADEKFVENKWVLNGEEVEPNEDGVFPDGAVKVETKHSTVKFTRLGVRYGELLAFVIAAM